MKVKKIYKVCDSTTGKYWNGNTVLPDFNDNGEKWTRKAALERALTWLLSRLRKNDPDVSLPENWQIIEYEIVETMKSQSLMSDFMTNVALKAELHKISWRLVSFYEIMEAKGVMKDIQFILKLKPLQGQKYVSLDCIKMCRAQLRLLGVKTRSFREYSGMFGMLSREQAMRARLVLDLESMVDMAELRI